MINLVEYKGLNYKSGLTPNERAYLEAKEQAKEQEKEAEKEKARGFANASNATLRITSHRRAQCGQQEWQKVGLRDSTSQTWR